MKVVVCEKKEIHLIEGTKVAGDEVELPEKLALRYLAQGAVERYETKVVRENPLPDAGAVEPLSALPVAPASTVTTVNVCVSGAPSRETVEQIAKAVKKRARKGSSR